MLPPFEVCFIHILKFPKSAIMLPLVQMHPHDNVCTMVIPFFVLIEYYNLSGKIQLFTLHVWINKHYVSLGAAKVVKWVRMPWKDCLSQSISYWTIIQGPAVRKTDGEWALVTWTSFHSCSHKQRLYVFTWKLPWNSRLRNKIVQRHNW